jgi:hypothetical protein
MSQPNPGLPDDPPPHLTDQPTAPQVYRPIEGAGIHVRIVDRSGQNPRCQAAIVVNVDAEDPLSAVFTVDAVVFVPPDKHPRDRFDQRPNTRPGSTRWANNMKYAEVTENKPLTWHYPGRNCLPQVVLDAAQN